MKYVKDSEKLLKLDFPPFFSYFNIILLKEDALLGKNLS